MATTKTAVVTGAHKGLGYEVSRLLSRQGYVVILTGRKAGPGKKAAADLTAKTQSAVHFVELDVTSDESIEKAAQDVSRLVDHLDVLVNNAGVFPDPDKSPLETNRAMMVEALKTNTIGPLRITQAFLPLLRKNASRMAARVVNVSSGLGSLTDMQSVGAAYSISKAGLNAVTRQLAAALEDQNIVVNSVCPGWCRTDMGGEGATRTAAEGAAGIAWLATEAPSSATGKFWRDGKEIAW